MKIRVTILVNAERFFPKKWVFWESELSDKKGVRSYLKILRNQDVTRIIDLCKYLNLLARVPDSCGNSCVADR